MARFVIAKLDEVALVKVVFEKPFVPLKKLLSVRRVEDAALSVMFAVPLNETPLMVRAFWSAVAVPALPETEPVIVCEKVLAPEKVLLLARSVVEAEPTVIEEPTLKAVPLMEPRLPVR